MKRSLMLLLLIVLAGCEGPVPRKPVKVKSGSFIKESVERNKQLLAEEEKLIQDIILKDSLHTYSASADGSWYYLENKNEESSVTAQTDDVITFTYNMLSLGNDTIYSEEELGIQEYKVDKQDLFPGLRSSLKLLKEGEKATFLFPSSMVYGYLGDKNKIGINVPIKSTITIIKIEHQNRDISQ
jgi:gliding motility-associated peptidyl-prolyl isomerase